MSSSRHARATNTISTGKATAATTISTSLTTRSPWSSAAIDTMPVAMTAANTSGLTRRIRPPDGGCRCAGCCASTPRALTRRTDREPRQQLLEQHPQLQPRQIRAKAVMHTLAETQVRVGLTRDVERIGIIERRRIAVGRTLPDLHLLPGLDPAATQLDVARWRCAASTATATSSAPSPRRRWAADPNPHAAPGIGRGARSAPAARPRRSCAWSPRPR